MLSFSSLLALAIRLIYNKSPHPLLSIARYKLRALHDKVPEVEENVSPQYEAAITNPITHIGSDVFCLH